MIALPPEWRKMDASDADGVDYIACGPVTSQGYAPTLLITRVRDTEPASIEKGMERILGNAHVDPHAECSTSATRQWAESLRSSRR